jgi:hypothetical protein
LLLLENVPIPFSEELLFTMDKGYWKVKVKIKLSLCLTKHYAVKAYWGSGGIAPHILDLGTRWR